jgi:hypothetical protein
VPRLERTSGNWQLASHIRSSYRDKPSFLAVIAGNSRGREKAHPSTRPVFSRRVPFSPAMVLNWAPDNSILVREVTQSVCATSRLGPCAWSMHGTVK